MLRELRGSEPVRGRFALDLLRQGDRRLVTVVTVRDQQRARPQRIGHMRDGTVVGDTPQLVAHAVFGGEIRERLAGVEMLVEMPPRVG